MNRRHDDTDGGLRRIVAALKASPPHGLPEDFADRVVAAALRRTERSAWAGMWRRAFDLLFMPRPVLLRPVWQVAYGVLLCALSAGATLWGVRAPSAAGGQAVLVRFALKAPGANQVALAGDFNAWDANGIRLQDPEGDEVWHIVLPLKPGVYQYMFVVDGKTWMPDPLGDDTVDDGFGQRNSLVKVVNFTPEGRGDPSVL
ncbi:hypothetical protein HYY27_03050 [bacterium]|nr:hypothetical protein [bacterium]